MKLRTDISTAKYIFSPLAALDIDEAAYKCEDALRSIGMGESRSVLTAVTFPKDSVAGEWESEEFWVNPIEAMDVLNGIAKSAGKSAMVDISTDEMAIRFIHEKVKASLPLLTSSISPGMPKVSPDFTVDIDTGGIDAALKTINEVWKGAKDDKVICHVFTEDGALKMEVLSSKESIRSVSVELAPASGTTDSIYSAELLTKALGAMPKGLIRLGLKSDFPILMRTLDSPFTVSSMVAPRIRDD